MKQRSNHAFKNREPVRNSILLQRILPRLQGHSMCSWRYLNEEQRCVLACLSQLGDNERLSTVLQELISPVLGCSARSRLCPLPLVCGICASAASVPGV